MPKNDLPREQWSVVQEAATAAARAAAPGVEGLAVRVYDDRERDLADARRRLVSGAAACAQGLLKGSTAMMTMAGNGSWNSPNGFDMVAFTALQEADEALIEAQRKISDLRRQTMEYVERGGWAEPGLQMQRAEERRRAGR